MGVLIGIWMLLFNIAQREKGPAFQPIVLVVYAACFIVYAYFGLFKD